MPKQSHPTGTAHLTLFDSPYQHAVSDMVLKFQQQLQEATTEEERQELRTAIASWTAAHGEPQKCTPAGSRRSKTSSNPDPKP